MPIKKKAAAPEPAGESAPMWIVSFADLVTLMMSFFVVLYALKQGGAQQQIETAAAIKEKFGYRPDPFSDSALDRAVRRRMGLQEPSPYDDQRGNTSTPANGATGSETKVETIIPGTQVAGGQVRFDILQTTLDSTAKKTLAEIAQKLKGHNNILMIKGHISTDELSQLINDSDPYGMGLSCRRALVVMEELVNLGINRNVLRAVACGSSEPLRVRTYTEDEQRHNRRAEVFTTDNLAYDYFPASTVSPTTNDPPPQTPATSPTNNE